MSNISVLQDFEDFLSYTKVESRKNKFIERISQEIAENLNFFNVPPIEINEYGDLTFYSPTIGLDDIDNFETIKFEDDLKPQLDKITKEVKVKIDNFLYSSTSESKIENLKKYIETKFKLFQSSEFQTFNKYPICNVYLEEIKSYLYNSGIILGYQNPVKTKFNFKWISNKNKKKFFTSLYHHCCDNEIIDSETTSKEDFINVFSEQITDSKIHFICDNIVIVELFQLLLPNFSKLKINHIIKSHRFYNKNETPLKANILYTTKSKGKKSISQKNRKILKETKDFFSNYFHQ